MIDLVNFRVCAFPKKSAQHDIRRNNLFCCYSNNTQINITNGMSARIRNDPRPFQTTNFRTTDQVLPQKYTHTQTVLNLSSSNQQIKYFCKNPIRLKHFQAASIRTSNQELRINRISVGQFDAFDSRNISKGFLVKEKQTTTTKRNY